MEDMYHYTESGLDNVWLKGGFEVHQTAYGEGVSIKHMDELHKVIGMSIAASFHRMNPEELRFLRVEMELSQKRLAELLHVESQAVARWENGKTKGGVPGPAELMIRNLYIEHAGGNPAVRQLCEDLAELDEIENAARLELEDIDGEWRIAA